MQSNKEKNFISIVLYIYNQDTIIYDFLNTIDHMAKKYFEKYEIICVNDASTDHSVEEINRYASEISDKVISILNMSFYQGIELSMNAGVDLSIGDFVYEFDYLSLSYPPNLLIDIYNKALSGYDIVSAVPSKASRAGSRLFYSIFNRTAHMQYLLRTESFRILSRRGINRIHSMSKIIVYRKASYANCGLAMDFIMYDNTEIRSNTDKLSLYSQKKTALDALILYTDVAYNFSVGFSVLMMFFSLFIGAYTVYTYIMGRPVAGWTTTMLFLSVAFCGLFLGLTVLTKYMSLAIRLIFEKQKYLVQSIEKAGEYLGGKL